MPRRLIFVILATLILATAVAGGLYWRWYDSPRYALQQMVLTIKTKDMDEFFNYLDLKEIFVNSLEGLDQDLRSQEKKEEGADDWTRLGRQLGRKFARQLLPKLFDGFEKQIRGGIEAYLLDLDNSQLLALATAVTLAKIEVQGDEAQVTIKDPKTGDTLRFKMRRQTEDLVWRIFSVNYQDLKKIIKKEFQGS
ncbi:MAG: hypothetical protein Q8M54_03095 [Desulfobaccales bacterium]|nr:hypothetical protein [Desulfobaccales bacterium]